MTVLKYQNESFMYFLILENEIGVKSRVLVMGVLFTMLSFTVDSFNFVGANFMDYESFAYSLGCNFVDASVFSFGKKTKFYNFFSLGM